jgi:hypothetical protein
VTIRLWFVKNCIELSGAAQPVTREGLPILVIGPSNGPSLEGASHHRRCVKDTRVAQAKLEQKFARKCVGALLGNCGDSTRPERSFSGRRRVLELPRDEGS